MKTDVVILGAGISGLATAYYLKKKGFNIHVLEKDSRTGGAIETKEADGFLVEHGPNSTLDTSPLFHELFKELGIEKDLIYGTDSAKNRYIVRNSKLCALPTNPVAFLKTELFSAQAKLRLLKEPFIAPSKKEETLAEFVRRRLGDEFLTYAIDPFVAGVYAGLPEQLSVQSAFPKLYNLEQRYGSLIKGAILGYRERKKSKETSKQSAKLFSFKEGMETLTKALTDSLNEHISTGADIKAISRNEDGSFQLKWQQDEKVDETTCRDLVFTIPSYAYDTLPLELPSSFRNTLVNIPYPYVTMVFFGYRSSPASIDLDGFGFLVPRVENRRILGTIWSSTLFPGRAAQGEAALTTFAGGSRQPEIAGLDDEELVEIVRKDLEDLMGIIQEPDVTVIRRWPRAIPQYTLEHKKVIQAVEDFEKNEPGIYISGNFRGGISVGDCIKQAHTVSEKVAERES